MSENCREEVLEYVFLQLALAARPMRNVGVLLLNPNDRRLYWQFRTDWDALAPAEDAEVLAGLDRDFARKVQTMGGEQFLSWLEDQLSNVLRISERNCVTSSDPIHTLQALFRDYCLS